MAKCNSIEWSNVYLLGDEKIDAEHKKLFDLALAIPTYRDSPRGIENAIQELIRYTKFHFTNEELYMRSLEYVHLSEHQAKHKVLIAKLQAIIADLAHKNFEQTYTSVLRFVNQDLIHHIMVEDKKVQHFRRNKLGMRTMFTWRKEYMLCHDMIDKDHQELFNIAYRAFSHNESKLPKEYVRKIIRELNEYMQAHFMREEEYMDSIEFPLLQEHKNIHLNIISQIHELYSKIPLMSLQQFEKELLSSIDIWLVNHILNEDQKIICFLRGIDLR